MILWAIVYVGCIFGFEALFSPVGFWEWVAVTLVSLAIAEVVTG